MTATTACLVIGALFLSLYASGVTSVRNDKIVIQTSEAAGTTATTARDDVNNGTRALEMGRAMGSHKLVPKVLELWTMKFNEELTEGSWLDTFATECLNGYHSYVAFHNDRHAFDVYKFVVTTFGTGKNDLKVQEIALAALCHDYGHPGLTNKFFAGLSTTNVKAKEARLQAFNKLREEEQAAVNTIKEGTTPKGGWNMVGLERKNAFGGSVYDKNEFGTYIPYEAGDKTLMGRKAMDEGCGLSCTSILESFHAALAKTKLLMAAAPDKYSTDHIVTAIMATDFGHDFQLRKLVADIKSKKETLTDDIFQKIALHVSDINNAYADEKDNSVWWAAAVNAEFAREGVITDGFIPATTVKSFATSQAGWATGVWLLMKDSFEVLGVVPAVGDPILKKILEMAGKWTKCAEIAEKAPKKSTKTQPADEVFVFGDLEPIQIRDLYIEKTVNMCKDMGNHVAPPE